MKAKVLLLLVVFAPVCTRCLSQQAADKRVYIDGDLLSVDVRDVPLFDILNDIAAETGIEVKVDPDVNQSVTASFKRVQIDRGIARIVKPLDYVIKWARIVEGDKTVDRITAMEIFRKGERERAQQILAGRSPADVPGEFEREVRERAGKEEMPGARPMRVPGTRSSGKKLKTAATRGDARSPAEGQELPPVSQDYQSRYRGRQYQSVGEDAGYEDVGYEDAGYDELSP